MKQRRHIKIITQRFDLAEQTYQHNVSLKINLTKLLSLTTRLKTDQQKINTRLSCLFGINCKWSSVPIAINIKSINKLYIQTHPFSFLGRTKAVQPLTKQWLVWWFNTKCNNYCGSKYNFGTYYTIKINI